jgi:RecA/RadA recombinase
MAKKKEDVAPEKGKRRRSRKSAPEAEAPVKEKKGKKAKKGSVVDGGFDPYAHLSASIDGMEKKFGLLSMAVSESEDRLSTGLLTIDTILAGGLLPGGWYTFFGGEQSCKSTLATTCMGSISTDNEFRGVGSMFDYEGSFQADYAENIFRYMNSGKRLSVDNVFGIKDDTGWVVQPRVRYYAPSVGEDFYNYLAKLEKLLPDLIQENGKFWYIYENTKINQKALAGKYDKEFFRRENKFRLPAPNGMPQAVILVDSYPAMVPKQTDDKDEGDKSLGSQARMHAANLPRVKGAMRSKRIIVLGINQLRDIPMAMYGPSEQEPGGKALRFYSDCRLRMTSVSVPHAKGQFEEEDTISGDGVDKYRYLKCKAIKNKLGGPQAAEISLRICVSDEDGNAKGFCRVWDAYQYLKMTGQLGGNRKKIKFLTGPLEGKAVSWVEFKALIDGDVAIIKKGCTKLKVKPFRLYEWCRKQVRSGEAYKMLKAAIKLESTTSRKGAAISEDADEE